MVRPLRSTPTSIQALRHYYEPVRRPTPHRYSTPRSFCCSPRSLWSPPGSSIGACLPTFRAKAADQAHVASMPDITWPEVRTPARLIPEPKRRPGFDAPWFNNDTSAAIHLRSSSRSPSDASMSAFSSSLTTTPSSRRESHPPAPTDPDVNLSIHPARAIQSPGRVAQLPVRKQAGHPFPDTTQPFPRTSVTAFQPFVLPSRPVHQVAINTPAHRNHHAWIEHREVVQPALEGRVHATARSLSVRVVRRCILQDAAFRLISVNLPGATAGRNP